MITTLEICSGPNQSFTCGVKRHFEDSLLCTIDVEDYPQHHTDLHTVGDFSFLCHTMNFSIYDIIWASIPCNTYSVASCSKHRAQRDYAPTTFEALQADQLSKNIVLIILQQLYQDPGFKFVIENPRGILRKMPFMKPLEKYRKTVSYCQYGDKRMKPTDIWTNIDFEVRMCKNGAPCHESAPRGSNTGTQGLTWAERCKIPDELIDVILKEVKI